MRSVVLNIAAVLAGGLLLPSSPALAADSGGPPVRTMTTDETAAYAIWSMRAALNVAALQCQFSPYLATVRNYNDLIKQHSLEFGNAYKMLEKHFRRLDGPVGGRRTFDGFTTRLYNSFSTLQGQLSFCAAAGTIGREALAMPYGTLTGYAGQAVVRLRSSLVAPPDPYRSLQLSYLRLPRIPDPCLDKRGRPVKRCKL